VAIAKPNLTIEMLSAERVTELWPELEPLFDRATKGNQISKEELEANDIFVLATNRNVCGVCGV
jgi:hypothetical protein